MLNHESLERILEKLPQLRIGVVGDLFLDRYWDIDPELTELSLETGLEAYQVTRVRISPGAAGTVVNNLAALGVGHVALLSVIGDDGEGYELRRALDGLKLVDFSGVIADPNRRTPTYTKPLIHQGSQPPRELNRIDIKNRIPMPTDGETAIKANLERIWNTLDALIVLDQVSEPNCGVVTDAVRQYLAKLAAREPGKFVLADSRARIDQFRSVCVKPNQLECKQAIGAHEQASEAAAKELALRTGRAVFCSCGEKGILLAENQPSRVSLIPAYPVEAPIDIVGAGDSASAAITCAVASGLSFAEAAAFGCLVASITIQQIGTTGTASPEQIRRRFGETIR